MSLKDDERYDTSAKLNFFFENGNVYFIADASLVEFVCLNETSDDRIFGSFVEISADAGVVPEVDCVHLFILRFVFVFLRRR